MRSAIISAIVATIIAAPSGFAVGSSDNVQGKVRDKATRGELYALRVELNDHEQRIAQLEEDGRGYNAGIVSIQRCIRNESGYAGVNSTMRHDMMSQCIDDWFAAFADEYGVDH
jgi:hypothetical protein